MSDIFRIPGHFRKWSEGNFPHFRCTIRIDGKHFIRTELLLDTGSPFTPITPKDYLKTRLHIKPDRAKMCYLASAQFYRVPINDKVEYMLMAEDHKLYKFQFADAIFLVPMDDKIKHVQSIPSILGLNFLTMNNLRFFTDPAKEVAYIEGTLKNNYSCDQGLSDKPPGRSPAIRSTQIYDASK